MTPEKKRLIQQLSYNYCSAYKLYYQIHLCHFNVEGESFYEMHKMLQKMYTDTWKSIDAIAEKIRQQDAYVPVGLEYVLKNGDSYEECSKFPIQEMSHSLVHSQELYIVTLNQTIQ